LLRLPVRIAAAGERRRSRRHLPGGLRPLRRSAVDPERPAPPRPHPIVRPEPGMYTGNMARQT
jgi:hypothetical protein